MSGGVPATPLKVVSTLEGELQYQGSPKQRNEENGIAAAVLKPALVFEASRLFTFQFVT